MSTLLIKHFNDSIIKTNMTKRIVIKNKTLTYPVFKIKLDLLFYNDQNDRIATWVSQYKSENNVTAFDRTDLEKYNAIIHKFITDSNKEALRKTQNNIQLIGQQEPGVILNDGRIIDGNRRFTCLRNIEKLTNKQQYFEAIILEQSIEDNEKEIKMLELMLQHGIDEKIDYSPIDRLVGIYTDIVLNKLLTPSEYASSINVSEKEIITELEKAQLMVEFLEFVNAPKKFHLAKYFDIIDPLKELNIMLKRVDDDIQKQKLKITIFAQFLIQPEGDSTRYMRKIKTIVTNRHFLTDYLFNQKSIVEKVKNVLKKYANLDKQDIIDIRSENSIKNDFLFTTEKTLNKVYGDLTRNLPIKQVENAYDSLGMIDLNIIEKLTPTQLEELSNNLNDLKLKIDEITSKVQMVTN